MSFAKTLSHWMLLAAVGTLLACSSSSNPASDAQADGATCQHQCAAVGTSCQGDMLETCTVDQFGCRVAETITCAQGCDTTTNSCTGCTDSCQQAGETQCQSGMLSTCEVDAQGCRDWSAPFACPQNQCADATTCAACAHECPAPGNPTCNGDVLETCTVDPAGCRVLSTETCTHGCTSGACDVCQPTGFGGPTTWTLPSGFTDDQLDDLFADTTTGCAEGQLSYGLINLVGDDKPDLVVADHCDAAGVGTTHWDVYENNGAGFAVSATTWSLPSGFSQEQLDDISADTTTGCAEGQLSYALLDLNGNGKLDLVVADNCDAAGVGSTHWDVYENNGSGFSDTATTWSLPTGFSQEQLDDVSADTTTGCAEGQLSYGLLDLTGDGKPDLVVADNCDAAGVGSDHWDIYANTGTGFANTATTWSLPSGFTQEQLDDLAADTTTGCAEGQLSYAVLDLQGDGTPDLVVADHCDATGVGTTHWEVYANTGSGFANTATTWSLPNSFTDEQLDDIAGDTTTGCAQGQLSYGLRDLRGTGKPDLVVADRCDAAGVGTTHWEIFENSGSAFSDTALTWTLPNGFTDEQLDDITADTTTGCSGGQLSYSVMDINGQGLPSLVVADKCDVAGVGTGIWQIHTPMCAP